MKHQYQVSIFYSTPTGRPAHISYKLEAKDEQQAEKLARDKFYNTRKGKGYKINGGDVYRLR
ncbi:hypothetical protein JMN32_08830 [Fulvivirga sp. 29W222]|uniref:Uncharacterized protein n=1 Tax=Fulvivirga marina TaxID=2494733 RepID=A0A937FUK7_9BACT|nr:hypothetical protein [Fulvivirga marina]MBL6446410.1 hypothetical protein [Fulvivirga marina]